MPYAYSPEYREMVLEQLRAGRLAREVAASLQLSEATVYWCKAQDSIDQGVRSGQVTSGVSDLRAARASARTR